MLGEVGTLRSCSIFTSRVAAWSGDGLEIFQIFKLLLELIKLQKVLTLFLSLLDFLVFVPLPSISLQAQELLGCGW